MVYSNLILKGEYGTLPALEIDVCFVKNYCFSNMFNNFRSSFRSAFVATLIICSTISCSPLASTNSDQTLANQPVDVVTNTFEPIAVDLDGYESTNETCLCSLAHPMPEQPKSYRGSGDNVTHAINMFTDKEYQSALTIFDKLIAEDTSTKWDYFNRGTTHLKLFNYEKALRDFESAIDKDPGFSEAYLNLGIAHYHQNDLNSAVSEISKSIQLSPEYSLALWNRGHVLGMQTKFAAAISDFDMAIKLAPNNAVNFVGRAIVLADSGDQTSARKDLEAALKLTADQDLINRLEATLDEMPASSD